MPHRRPRFLLALSAPSAAATLASAVAAVSTTALPRVAQADVSSWLAVGGGYAGQAPHGKTSFDSAGAFSYSIGVGSSPLQSFVVGGVFRGTTMFGLGTDIGPAVRAATGGFARGDWGVALDAGALWRSWGSDAYGTWPVQGVLTVGAPWGLELALGAQFASVSGGTPSEGFFASLELDLLRFTVMRQGPTERWWPNPSPAGGHPDDKQSGVSSGYGCAGPLADGCPSSALIE
jgi:hypothetical protein